MISLTDDEWIVLDGHCRPETQALVDAAKARLAAVAAHADLDPRHAGFIANVVTQANERGRLRWVSARIDHCRLCDTKPYGYLPYKSGPNRGLPNPNKRRAYPAIEVHDRGFGPDSLSVMLGGCQDCLAALKPLLIKALADVRAQVPEALAAEGRPAWRRYELRRCQRCGWEGHDGQEGRETLAGGGYRWCPQCGSKYPELTHRKGHVVELEGEYVHERRHGTWGYWPVEAKTTTTEPDDIVVTVEADADKVVDLMAALERSVAAVKDARARRQQPRAAEDEPLKIGDRVRLAKGSEGTIVEWPESAARAARDDMVWVDWDDGDHIAWWLTSSLGRVEQVPARRTQPGREDR